MTEAAEEGASLSVPIVGSHTRVTVKQSLGKIVQSMGTFSFSVL